MSELRVTCQPLAGPNDVSSGTLLLDSTVWQWQNDILERVIKNTEKCSAISLAALSCFTYRDHSATLKFLEKLSTPFRSSFCCGAESSYR
eukprot:g80820.t1